MKEDDNIEQEKKIGTALLFIVGIIIFGCILNEPTNISFEPLDTKFVEAHYEYEQRYRYRPPCFYEYYTEEIHVPDRYYVLYNAKCENGPEFEIWLRVTKEEYEETIEELNNKIDESKFEP